jgi:hypothetical protein
LRAILQRALVRDLNQRYPDADELLYDLEHYIYHRGYGPINETLGRYRRDLFGQKPPAVQRGGETLVCERPAPPLLKDP